LIGATGILGVTDLAFRPEDGALFGITFGFTAQDTNAVYLLSPTNAGATLVGPHGFDLSVMSGRAFGPIPEPASGMLVLGALSVLLRRAKR
jgi:hypothetical protein